VKITNLEVALAALSERESNPARLEQAVAAYRAALLYVPLSKGTRHGWDGCHDWGKPSCRREQPPKRFRRPSPNKLTVPAGASQAGRLE
jgi:hypothetical protein